MPTAEELISVASIERLASILRTVAPQDSDWAEVRASAATLGPLGLSDRARTVRDALLRDLPGGYTRLAAVVRAALERPDLSGWMVWPVTEAVAATADAAHFDEASSCSPRRYYSGPHSVELQVNGYRFGQGGFVLDTAPE